MAKKQDQQPAAQSPTVTRDIPRRSIVAKFRHRDDMKRRGVRGVFHRPRFMPPAVELPVDSTGNATVLAPMDGNDTLGICGPAMCDHVDRIWAWRQGQGRQLDTNLAHLEQQYLHVSGGDNGVDESMLVQPPSGIWLQGIAGDKSQVIVDSLDIDVTDTALARFAIHNFYAVCMAWSVPDSFLQEFDLGTVWPDAMRPNPANGHYTNLADVAGPADSYKGRSLNGYYRLWTWGAWCWVSPEFVHSVQPQTFVAFSSRQFDSATGLDSKGRHIRTQAQLWKACSGNEIPESLLSQFPPLNGPTPTPAPTPTPTPTPTPAPGPSAQQIVDAAFAYAEKIFAREPRIVQLLRGLNQYIDKLLAKQDHAGDPLPASGKLPPWLLPMVDEAFVFFEKITPAEADLLERIRKVIDVVLGVL